MPLLGWPLIISLSLALIFVTGAIPLLWTRVGGPRVVRYLQRLGMLVVMQVVCTALVAAGVNNYGYFYGSWSDLFGGGGGLGSIAHVGGGVQASAGRFIGAGGPSRPLAVADASWSTPATYAVRGELLSTTVVGSRTGLSAPTVLYLPPQYFQRSYAHHKFPAVEVFPGYPGSVDELVKNLGYPQLMLDRIRAQSSGPMILVMLDPAVMMPRDTECTDVPGGPRVLTFLADEVPAAVRAVVRARTNDWGVMGYSTGGFCAAKMSLTHPEQFPAAVSMSGYYHVLTDSTTGDLFGGSRSLRDLNSPEWLLAHLPTPHVSMLLSIGGAETGSDGLIDTHRFVSEVHAPLSADVIVVPHGAHNFADIAQVIPTALSWMWRHLPG